MTPPRVVRNVLLDAFGTLVSPRRPVHLQYVSSRVPREPALVAEARL